MTRHRLTKRQIKEDPLVTWVGRIRTWTTLNARRLLIGGALVVLVVGSVLAMRNARRSAELEAATQLSQAQYHLWGENLQQAIDLSDDIEQRWPGTRSARMAALVRADALLRRGESEEALTAYRAFLDHSRGNGVTRVAALRGAAVALEDVGQYAEAAAQYVQLAREEDRGPLVGQDLVSAARCRARAGDTEGARALYQEVIDEYPDLRGGFDVRLKLLELGAPSDGQS